MAVLLHRLGHSAYRRRKTVLAGWLVVLAGLVTCVSVFGGKARRPLLGTRYRVTTRAGHAQQDAALHVGIQRAVVLTAPAGQRITHAPYAGLIARTVKAAEEAPQVSAVVDPREGGAVSDVPFLTTMGKRGASRAKLVAIAYESGLVTPGLPAGHAAY
jgi:RND superfamily putative drug exporter